MTVLIEVSDRTARTLARGERASKEFFNAVDSVCSFAKWKLDERERAEVDEPVLAMLSELDDAVGYERPTGLIVTATRLHDGIVTALISNGVWHLEKLFTDSEISEIVSLHVLAEAMVEEWREGPVGL